MTDELAQLLRDLEAERCRPVPPRPRERPLVRPLSQAEGDANRHLLAAALELGADDYETLGAP